MTHNALQTSSCLTSNVLVDDVNAVNIVIDSVEETLQASNVPSEAIQDHSNLEQVAIEIPVTELKSDEDQQVSLDAHHVAEAAPEVQPYPYTWSPQETPEQKGENAISESKFHYCQQVLI
jgi:hypothetical protein